MNDLVSRQALLDTFGQWQKTEDYSNDEWNLLVDVLNVIKSMPPEPQLSTNLAEVGTDCISRQAAIDALCNDYCGGWQDCKYYPNCENLRSVQKLPSAQPAEPKRGKWHYSDGKPARIGLSFGVICDQCGTESEYCTNFCGECGADMREVTT